MPRLHATTTPSPPPGPPKICLIKNLVFWHLNVSEANLVPLTIGGMAVGVGGVSYLLSSSAAHIHSRVSYAIIFGFFFVMNFSAIVLHCFSPTINSALVSEWMLFLDGLGTSGVGVSLIIAALVDLKVLPDAGRVKLTLSGLLYLAFCYGWYSTVFNKWPLGFPLLYLLVTVIGAVSYFVLQFVWLIKNGFNKSSFFLLGAFLVGMLGLQTIRDPALASYLCDHLPHWLAGETPWFVASDLSLFLLLKYVTKRQNSLYVKLMPVSTVEEGFGFQK
eukprot:TRINITY_DN2337_c0_g1_i2.p1 TRINITY_DN2337_c0_g1~~TRINITY_DN2337_c0_g1_i2.p1  ORF type:complete len:275 (+),score=71.44 TRINITY_DN2337_c0_g1_i2:233-1057(+)